MLTRDHLALELDKVLAMLAAEATLPDAAAQAQAQVPSADPGEVRRRLDATIAAVDLTARFGAPNFSRAKPVAGPLRRAAAGGILSMKELLEIAGTLRAVRAVVDWRRRCENYESCLDEAFSLLAPNKYLEDKITAAILSEDEIADHASPELATIRRKIRAASARAREQLDRMVRSPAYQKLLQDPIVTIRDGRFVVPVKQEHRAEVPGLVHDTSGSGATLFVEPMAVVEANNEIRILQSKEADEIERILAALSAEAGTFADAIIADYDTLVALNLIFAKAHLAYNMKASAPNLSDSGYIKLARARHPLIDPKKVVPVDVELGGGFDTLVITGPNTGGKTVTLKTLGLLTLMVMCGLLPTVGDGSTLAVFDRVLADIGDEQSIEQSLSTFSSHMTNLIRIIGEADSRSLVLLDELGAGTDPVEGAALAAAILERLRAAGARIAATTHYAELKVYAIHTPGVENGCCEFDVATLRPTYRLLVGIPGRSNAFAISLRLGLDQALVDRAQSLVGGDSQRLEEVVLRLDAKRQALEGELAVAEQARAVAEQANAKAIREVAELEAIRERETEKAKTEARRIVERARLDAEALVRELEALRKQKEAADFSARAGAARSSLRATINKMEDAIDPVTQKKAAAYTLPRPLRVGDSVLIVDIDKKGVVTALGSDGGPAEVLAGIIKTRVAVNNLRLLENNEGGADAVKTAVQKAVKSRAGSGRATRSAATEIDLRGFDTNEAVLEADRFLDNAVLTGLERVTLIHGKGTGALRSAIQQHLKRHPSVKGFRLGAYGEGETGVTVVELK